jgi:pyruvate ferredoxin oxidoreductase beta subunit
MNTGIQKSSLTPFGSRTTTTPAGKNIRGNLRPKKNMFEIVAAHGIKYAATASIGYLNDYMNKVKRASEIKGTKYIHVSAPCPVGWGFGSDETIELAKEAVDCGLWALAEYEDGNFKINMRPKNLNGLTDYIKRQGRFRHLKEEDITVIEMARDKKWEYIGENWG